MTDQWKEPGENDVQMPLGTGGESPEEEGGGAARQSRVSGPTAVLFGAFASALVIIYLVGMQNRPRTASAEQSARDLNTNSAITDLLQNNGKAQQLQGLFTDTRKLVPMIYSYLGAQKSEIPPLTHDPFGEPEAPVAAPVENHASEAVKIVTTNPVDAEKLRRVAETFGSLKLQSVMTGKTSVAMINNRLVQVGNRIGDLTVTGIESDRVLLTYNKSTFELKLAGGEPERQ